MVEEGTGGERPRGQPVRGSWPSRLANSQEAILPNLLAEARAKDRSMCVRVRVCVCVCCPKAPQAISKLVDALVKLDPSCGSRAYVAGCKRVQPRVLPLNVETSRNETHSYKHP